MNAKDLIDLFKETFKEWGEDGASRLGAAVAYYTVFSLAPLLVVIIAVAGLVFGGKAVQGQLVGQIEGLVGHDGAQMIQTMIANASRPSTSIIATVIGVVTLLLGATGLFGELQSSFNLIWKVKPKPRGILATIKDRVLSFSMVVGIAFLLMVSLVISAGLAALGQFLGSVLPVSELFLHGVNFVISFAIITALFAMMYKVLPDAVTSWRAVWIGAAVTSLLFAIGKLLIGLYLGHSGTTSTYGAAGSLVILLLWVYYSAQIVFFGAEFTQIYGNRFGSKVRPTPNATSVRESVPARVAQPAPPPTRWPSGNHEPVGAGRKPDATKKGSGTPSERAASVANRPSTWRTEESWETTRRPSGGAIVAAGLIAIGLGIVRYLRVTNPSGGARPR